MPDLFTHRTGREALESILADGAIRPVAEMAAEDPEREVSVESVAAPFLRRTVQAQDADNSVFSLTPERTREIYLTRNGIAGGKKYGDYIIVKRLNHPEVSPHLNTMKDEYISSRPLSVRSNATVYVPDDEVGEWSESHPRIRFGARSDLDLPEYSPYNVAEFARKLKGRIFEEKTASVSLDEIRQLVGRNTHYHGSKAIGVDHENSDDDFLSLQSSPSQLQRTLLKLRDLGFHRLPIPEEKLIRPEENMLVPMRGDMGGTQIDMMLAYGPQARERVKSVYRANDLLSEDRRRQITEKKKALKESWLFPKTRHRRYVEKLDQELGIAPLWERRDGSVDHDVKVTPKDLRRWFGPNARFTGATALGIDTPESDLDVYVPYKGEAFYERALNRLQQKGFDLISSPWNFKRDGVHVLSGHMDHHGSPIEVDVTFGTGEKAWARQKSIEEAAARLSEDEREAIRQKKQSLKNAWFFPERRYAAYKRRLDEDLGIIRL